MPNKIELSVYEYECETCGDYEVYELLLNGECIASYETHFGYGDHVLSDTEGIITCLIDKGLVNASSYEEKYTDCIEDEIGFMEDEYEWCYCS